VAERRASTAQINRQTLQQRGAEATRELREALHLPPALNDTAILGTALAKAAAVEVRRNATFAREVRREYAELTALRGQTSQREARRAAQEALPPLVPVRTDLPFRPIDPFAPPDPHFLSEVYGRQQLGRALQEYTVDILKRTAAATEARHPGTKPRNRGQRQPLINYIVEQYNKEQGG
jgi:hypothetical protein